METLVSVVILNWNGKKLLAQFLPSIVKYTSYENVEIVVADNGSTDDSIPFIQDNFPQIKIIDNQSNFGFAGGYNKALATIESKYFLLLNSDVEVSEHWLPPLIEAMEEDATIFACQPKIKAFHNKEQFEYAGAAGGFIDSLGFPFCRGRMLDYCENDVGQYNQASEIFWASGACFVVKADIFKAIGGFDTDFFAHMEEIDLCWRAKNLGYKITYSPYSTVFHVGGGTLQKTNSKKTYLNFYNNSVMVLKNENTLPYLLTYIPRRFIYFAAFLQFLIKGEFQNAKAVFMANFNFLWHLPKWIKAKNKQKISIEKYRINPPNLAGKYSFSIIFQHKILGKQKYSELKQVI